VSWDESKMLSDASSRPQNACTNPVFLVPGRDTDTDSRDELVPDIDTLTYPRGDANRDSVSDSKLCSQSNVSSFVVNSARSYWPI